MARHPVIIIDGKRYRKRRGKLVQIPDEWVGKTVHPQTKRKRKLTWVSEGKEWPGVTQTATKRKTHYHGHEDPEDDE